MIEAPRQDWQWYESMCRSDHAKWLRCLTPAESFRLYEELHDLAMSQMVSSPGTNALERRSWQEKLAVRRRLRQAFNELDRVVR